MLDITKELGNVKSQVKENNYPEPVPGRVAHIDADFMCYQVSAETKDELSGLKPRRSLDDMKYNARQGLNYLMRCAGATSYIAHLTPSGSNKGNRDAIALTKGYQANRDGKEKAEHIETIRTYIGEELPSAIHLDCEADDGMSMANYAAKARGESHLSVIVSKDKDLRIPPGLHYDFDSDEVVYVDDPFGDIWVDRTKKSPKVLGWGTKFFWCQLLMGDPADNINGIPSIPHAKNKDKDSKVGAITAYGLIEPCTSDAECFALCKKLWASSRYEWHDYRDGSPTTWGQHMLADMKLLWMRREPDQEDVVRWLGEVVSCQ
jgi:DNA polymerase-1